MAAKRVLIVDDDRDFLGELKDTLQLSGYVVDMVSEAGKVIDFVSHNRPDVILLDMKLGGMTGFELAKRLRCSPDTARIPVIAMSGYFNEDNDCTLFDFFQIKQCLQKPFNPLDIISQIESLDNDADTTT